MLKTIIQVHFEGFTKNYPFLFEGLQNIVKGMWRAEPQNKGSSPSILFHGRGRCLCACSGSTTSPRHRSCNGRGGEAGGVYGPSPAKDAGALHSGIRSKVCVLTRNTQIMKQQQQQQGTQPLCSALLCSKFPSSKFQSQVRWWAISYCTTTPIILTAYLDSCLHPPNPKQTTVSLSWQVKWSEKKRKEKKMKSHRGPYENRGTH